MILTYKFYIYPSKNKLGKLNNHFCSACFVYNLFPYSTTMHEKMNTSFGKV